MELSENPEAWRVRLDEIVGLVPTGKRLPAERALSHRLGIGRDTLRCALRDLQEEERIEIRAQSGSYVRSRGTGGS